jgi:hypothetical protein
MYINRPSILLVAFILALTQSTTSHPIRTSKWVKIEQFEDPNDRGIWKVFEKEGYHDQLPDPPHVKHNGVSTCTESYIFDSATYLYQPTEPSMAHQPKQQTNRARNTKRSL